MKKSASPARPKPAAAKHRQKQKAETRALIIDTARNLFEKMGYEGVTMRALAAETEMGYGTIFKHFSNKKDLLAACLQEEIETTLIAAFRTLPASASLQNQFMHVAKKLIRHYARRPRLSKTLIENIVLVEGGWKSAMDSQVERFLNQLEALIQAAKNRGEIRKDVDARLLSFSFFSNYLSTLILGLRAPKFDPQRTIETLELLIDLLLKGALESRA